MHGERLALEAPEVARRAARVHRPEQPALPQHTCAETQERLAATTLGLIQALLSIERMAHVSSANLPPGPASPAAAVLSGYADVAAATWLDQVIP